MAETQGEAASAGMSGAAYLRLVLLGALIGIPAALVAALFLAMLHELEHLLWDVLPQALGAPSPPWYLVIGLPIVGAVLVWAARTLLPGDGGHRPLEGFGRGPTPLEFAPGIVLAAVGSLAFGAVLGPEAPLVALGSVVGVAVTRLFRLRQREAAVLGTAGSFSAISALFGGPLVAGMLLLESGLAMGTALLPALLPGLVAAAVGYVLFIGLDGWGGLSATALDVQGLPMYAGTHLLDLAVAVGVGVVAALIVAAVRLLAARLEGFGRGRHGMVRLLLLGGLAIGLLAQLAQALGGNVQDVLFSGQTSVPDIINQSSIGVVVGVLVTKALAYAVCLGSGFRGGPVFPAIFLGVGVATLAVIGLGVSPTLAVAVGTAAGMAAGTRLLFSSVLLAALLVGRQGLDAVPAAVLAAAAAWITVAALDRRKPSPGRSAQRKPH
ncbi:chloride channel protein [Raineyella sp.]|uniref:Putative ion-transport protein YfeO n=1 Tax=bioreactor metagenome TaxID=1076179 RepID=A0A644XFK8_9ZZZZ|nr:chloride channel protein [Raineyella sp.]MEA5154354.1 chloride channel protein [Raineyella sp.]